MNEETNLRVGSSAPDFTLKDQDDEDLTLSSFKGYKVLLSFHPLAWTTVCAKQMMSLEDNFERLEELNCVPLGISVDSVPCKKAWAEHLGIINTRLLSDFWPHGGVARQYDLFREYDGISQRANIIVDEDGNIEFVKVYELSELPAMEEIIKHLKGE